MTPLILLAFRLFCFNIRQHGLQIFLNYMWTAANFMIEGYMRQYGRRLSRSSYSDKLSQLPTHQTCRTGRDCSTRKDM